MKKLRIASTCITLLIILSGCAAEKTPEAKENNTNTSEAIIMEARQSETSQETTSNSALDQATSVLVNIEPTHTPSYGISLSLPEDWTYQVEQTVDDPTSGLTVNISPKGVGSEGVISIAYMYQGFSDIGTGFEEKDIVLNGYEAIQGFYDGHMLWSFICLKNLEDCVIINSADNWYDEYAEEIEKILSTVEFIYYETDASQTIKSIDDLLRPYQDVLDQLNNEKGCSLYIPKNNKVRVYEAYKDMTPEEFKAEILKELEEEAIGGHMGDESDEMIIERYDAPSTYTSENPSNSNN